MTETNNLTQLTQLIFKETDECHGYYTERLKLDAYLTYTLAAINLVSMILIWLTNSAVIYAITSLSLCTNTSIKLILILCVSDLCIGVFAVPVYIITLLSDKNCILDCTAEFLSTGFGHLTGYVIAIIGYDRFFRLKYLNEYSTKMKAWKANVALVTIFVMSLSHAIAHVYGIKNDHHETIVTIGIGIDALLLVVALIPYALAIRVLKKHRKCAANQELLKKTDKTVTSIATRIMIAIIAFYTPYVVMTVLHAGLPSDSHFKEGQIYLFMWFISFTFIYANSFVNSVIFLSLNSKCRQKILALFHVKYKERSALAV